MSEIFISLVANKVYILAESEIFPLLGCDTISLKFIASTAQEKRLFCTLLCYISTARPRRDLMFFYKEIPNKFSNAVAHAMIVGI